MKEHHIRIVNIILASLLPILIVLITCQVYPEYQRNKYRPIKVQPTEVREDGAAVIVSRTGHQVFDCGPGIPCPGIYLGPLIWALVTMLGSCFILFRKKAALFIYRFSFLSVLLASFSYLLLGTALGHFDSLSWQLRIINLSAGLVTLACILSICGLIYLHNKRVVKVFNVKNQRNVVSYSLILIGILICSFFSYKYQYLGCDWQLAWFRN
jgi:hypothetical protein